MNISVSSNSVAIQRTVLLFVSSQIFTNNSIPAFYEIYPWAEIGTLYRLRIWTFWVSPCVCNLEVGSVFFLEGKLIYCLILCRRHLESKKFPLFQAANKLQACLFGAHVWSTACFQFALGVKKVQVTCNYNQDWSREFVKQRGTSLHPPWPSTISEQPPCSGPYCHFSYNFSWFSCIVDSAWQRWCISWSGALHPLVWTSWDNRMKFAANASAAFSRISLCTV